MSYDTCTVCVIDLGSGRYIPIHARLDMVRVQCMMQGLTAYVYRSGGIHPVGRIGADGEYQSLCPKL
jgi:hypothetical protein